MKIFLDDQIEDREANRKPPEGFMGVRNFAEFKEILESGLENGEKIEALYFDNDLGEGEMQGWEIAKWVTEAHPEVFKDYPELKSHSANTGTGGGKESIEYYFEWGRRHWKELLESKERPYPFGEIEME